MKVDIWSDIVCPWCYVGQRRFKGALAHFPHRDEVEVTWRAFELDPDAPPERQRDYVAHLASKYRVSPAEAEAMIERMTRTAAAEGLRFRFDIARPGNTFDAHRLLHLGAARGIQDPVKERLLAATFVEGRAIGERDTLMRLAVEAGLDERDARSALDGGAYAGEVRADEREAAALGITGVPYFLVDRAHAVSGAQPSEVLVEVLRRAWADRHAALATASAATLPVPATVPDACGGKASPEGPCPPHEAAVRLDEGGGGG